MRARIIRIGNSQGIRIPKPVLAQAGLEEEVELRVAKGALVIRPAATPRAGWAAAFQQMARRGDDALLDGASPPTTWDEEDWQW